MADEKDKIPEEGKKGASIFDRWADSEDEIIITPAEPKTEKRRFLRKPIKK